MKCWLRSPPDETGLSGIKCMRDALKCLADSRHEGRRRKGSVFVYHSWQEAPNPETRLFQGKLWAMIRQQERFRGYAAHNKQPHLYRVAEDALKFLATFARIVPGFSPRRVRRVAGVEVRLVLGSLEAFTHG